MDELTPGLALSQRWEVRWDVFDSDGVPYTAWSSCLMAAIGHARLRIERPATEWAVVLGGRIVWWAVMRDASGRMVMGVPFVAAKRLNLLRRGWWDAYEFYGRCRARGGVGNQRQLRLFAALRGR